MHSAAAVLVSASGAAVEMTIHGLDGWTRKEEEEEEAREQARACARCGRGISGKWRGGIKGG